MTILGNIIKTGIELSSFLREEYDDIAEVQIKQLRHLIYTARETSFGRYYGFESLSKVDDPRREFAQRIPIFDYHTFEENWWNQQQKYPDITWPGRPDFFALSSGTTGKTSKRIPISDDMIESMRSVSIQMLQDLKAFHISKDVFEKEVFLLSSTSDLHQNEHGFLEGEISGINIHNFPGWFDLFYRPGKEIAQIDSWDERLELIVKEAPSWDIGSMAGIPSWILVVLNAIIERYGLETIHDIWPHLEVYSTGGVAFEAYRANFNKISKKPLIVMDTYLASEGFFGYQSKPDSMAMKMAFNHGIYYEFIPFNERSFDASGQLLEDAEALVWEEVEEGKDYAMIISSCAGAWRYMIGDTIKFTDKTEGMFVLTGRTKFFLNVVGSQLSEEKINAGIHELSEKLGVGIEEFTVGALQNEDLSYFHQWVLASDDHIDDQEAALHLDEILKSSNKNYAVARSRALKEIKVKTISKETFYNWLESHKQKGGQVKTPKVMDAETMQGLLDFISD